MTTETAPATLVQAELETAREAEAQAERELGDAQLTAINGGRRVPGALVEKLEEARRYRVAMEAAASASDRQTVEANAAAQTRARGARLALVHEAIGHLDAALQDVDAGLVAFAATGAGKRAHEAMVRLRQLTADAAENTLTPEGWLIAQAIHNLRVQGKALIDGAAAECLTAAMAGTLEPGRMLTVTRYMRERLVPDLEGQPATWPAQA